MLTATNRQPGRRHAVSARPGVHRRRRLGLAAQDAVRRSRATGPAAPSTATPRRSTELQRKQRPQLSASGCGPRHYDPTPDVAERLRRLGCRSTRSAASASGSVSNVGFKSPGFDINDVGFLQRADQRTMSNWMQVRTSKPSRVAAQLPLQPQSVGRLELRRRPPVVGRQRQRARGVHEQLGHRHRRQRRTRRSFDDRATRGGPGGYRNRATNHLGLRQQRRPSAAVVGQRLQLSRRRRHGSRSGTSVPSCSYRPVVVPEDQRRPELQPQPRRLAVDRARATATTSSAGFDQKTVGLRRASTTR